MPDKTEDFINDLFTDARHADSRVSDDLLARVLADAATEQPPADVAPVTISLWDRILDIFGGWPALSGVAAAGVAGLWVGLAPPAGVENIFAELLGTQTEVQWLPDLDGLELLENVDG